VLVSAVRGCVHVMQFPHQQGKRAAREEGSTGERVCTRNAVPTGETGSHAICYLVLPQEDTSEG
jgi:hypothetical protein